ncbi:hypothetical protein BDW59DRAFT_162930 [Aspergillus cavernicola]|uniref:Creatinase N-terminal domain-containing protein n=1 Tax=Aspergillus cavernicola TaxID=176166 RepID=A0ABR4I7P1_9EURO
MFSPGVPKRKKTLIKDRCRETLDRWLVLNKFSLTTVVRRPKIWYLTGLYELKDTLSFSGDKRAFGVRGGISAELLALLGAPVGASAEAERAKSQMQSVQIKEPLVWAARYQLLDARYLHLDEDAPVPRNLVSLRPKPIFSKGHRGDEDDTNYAELSLLELEPDLIREDGAEESAEYRRPLLEAQQNIS